MAAGARRERAPGHGRPARRQRRRRAGPAVRRRRCAAGARPAAAHEQLQYIQHIIQRSVTIIHTYKWTTARRTTLTL